MLAQFGFGVFVLTFLLALFSVGAAVVGYFDKSDRWVEAARRAMLLIFPLITLAVLALAYLLVTGHYELQYVYSVTSNDMPFYLKITALWGGQAGSLVLWSWLMSAFASAVTLRKWERDRELLPWVIVVTSVTLAFFLSLTILFENPFTRWWQTTGGDFVAHMFAPAGAIPVTPADGQGLNPLLRHPGMIIHPPMLYLGFVAFVIPYAFAIAALVTGRSDDRWIRLTRRWTLVAWLFLSLGLVLGMRWAYDVLGWGGYWAWDPVETASLMPWLAGTAFLHSVMIQEKRGMFKQWNMLLIILTYALVIFGTFLTRSGVFSSVHAFAQSAIGPMFFAFIGITFVTSVALLIYRWKDLRAEVEMNSLFSREALFLLNNLLFMGVLIVCFWGVIFPLISELVTGQKVTVGPPFYLRANGPLFGALMALMGIAPLSAWGKSTYKTLGRALWKPSIPSAIVPAVLAILGVHNWIALVGFTLVAFVIFVTLFEFWRGARSRQKKRNENFLVALWQLAGRNRRRYGGYLIHLSMVVMAIGILGIELYQTTTQKTLAVGEDIQIAGYTLRFDSLAQFPYTDGRIVTRAALSVFRGAKFLGDLYPRYDYYTTSGQPMTIAGVRSTLADDLYVVLVNWEDVSAAQAPFKVYHNPLVNWLWIGSLMFIFGFLVAAWPEREEETREGKI
ncbi:MAG: heme lyase CcmF/NrfE family subunit [Candidatus Atribacteria bacterium]|nr:heme lyase CcmF/NrfE family subunit [Candidatus Atribacteria bacterium]